MQINNNAQATASNSVYILLVFLLSPILAVFFSIRRYKEVWAKNIVWLFSAFYGFTFVIGNSGSDINRYKERFDMLVDMQMSFKEYLELLRKENATDFLQPMLSYFTSLITSDFRIWVMLSGVIFGFFFSRNIWNVLALGDKKPAWYGLLFIMVFSFIFAVWDINVMRFTIATHIFIYGAFKLIVQKKRAGYIFLFLSPLMHFSFFIAIPVCILYRIIGNYTKAYFMFFILSFMVSELNLSALKSQLTFLPQTYREQSSGYLNEDYKEHRESLSKNKNFRGKFYQSSLKWSVAILLAFIFFNRKKIADKKILRNLFAFTLLFIGIFNIFSVIPSMNRFLFVGYLFAFALFYLYFNDRLTMSEKRIIYICTPLILFYFVMKLRIGLEFTGLFTVLGGPLSAAFNEGDIALIRFLK